MRKFLRTLLLSVGCLSAAAASQGANISVSTTAQLQPWMLFQSSIGPMIGWPYFDLPQPVSISVGDVVQLDVHFAPGQSITMFSNGGTQYGFAGLQLSITEPENTSNFSISDTNLSLFNGGGAAVLSVSSPSQSNCCAQITTTNWWSTVPAGSSITFDSFRVSFTVASLQDTTKLYATAAMTFGSLDDGALVINMSPVPEPATWALMLLGIAGVAAWSARRAQRA